MSIYGTRCLFFRKIFVMENNLLQKRASDNWKKHEAHSLMTKFDSLWIRKSSYRKDNIWKIEQFQANALFHIHSLRPATNKLFYSISIFSLLQKLVVIFSSEWLFYRIHGVHQQFRKHFLIFFEKNIELYSCIWSMRRRMS